MKTAIGLVLLLVVVSGAYFFLRPSSGGATNFRTAAVRRGTIAATISATGTIEPEELVDVGAQVAGRILTLGRDVRDPNKTIDYNSVVEKDTVLANIDDALYKAQVEQSEAALIRAKADVRQYEAKLLQATQEWKRAEALRPSRAIADSDYDLALANYKAAEAYVAVGEAAIRQAEATLSKDKTNYSYTVIKSPVRGVIIDRRVNVGQTVVASLNAPSLFLIAKDLRRMQVWASVNEADIGRIREGMPVRFSVDAFPGEPFEGTVYQVRMNAQTTQNVVTYTVVVSTDNTSLRLRPYLTANLQFMVEQRNDVLLVPNTALRWKPRPTQVAAEYRDQVASSGKGFGKGERGESGKRGSPGTADAKKEMANAAPANDSVAPAAAAGKGGEGKRMRKSGEAPAGDAPARGRSERGKVWVKTGDFVRPIELLVGVSDGMNTEVESSELKEGMEVVIGEATVAERASDDTTSPFAPKLFPRGGTKRGG